MAPLGVGYGHCFGLSASSHVPPAIQSYRHSLDSSIGLQALQVNPTVEAPTRRHRGSEARRSSLDIMKLALERGPVS